MTKTPPYIPPPPLPKTHHLGLIAHTTLANHSLVVVIPFKVTPGTTVVLPDNDYDDNLVANIIFYMEQSFKSNFVQRKALHLENLGPKN